MSLCCLVAPCAIWAAFLGSCQPHLRKSFTLVDVSQSPKQQRCVCLNSLLQHTCTVGREGTRTQTRLVQLWELDSMRSSWVPSNSRSSMINLPAAMDGIVRAETGACTSQCMAPSTHHLLLPSLSDGSRGSARSLTEHLATGVNQQRTARFHFAPAWEIPAPRRKPVIPGELCRSRAGAGDQVGIARRQMLPALVHRVPFLLGDVVAGCTEVLLFGRSCALSPRPSRFEQLDARAR